MRPYNLKFFIVFKVVFLIFFSTNAQVGIGTTQPNPSSVLDVSSNEAGVLIPRLTTAQRNAISNPANSLLIYNTDEEAFEYYSNGSWFQLNKKQNCGFLSVPNEFDISMEKGTNETISINLLNTLGTPGNINTALIFASSGFNFTVNSITNNNNPAPITQDINFTLENSSTAVAGSTGQLIFQLTADCGEVIYITVNVTITGCDFTIEADNDIIYTTLPASGTRDIIFNFIATQSGTTPGTVNLTFNDNANIIETSSSPCNYDCGLSFTAQISDSTPLGTYVYNLDFASSCGTTVSRTITLVVEGNPRDCKQILADNPSAASGVYQIDPDGIGSIVLTDCYCDMTTDGGGWTLVLNYNHLGGTNPNDQPRSSTLPLLGSTTLGMDESNTTFWGHTSNNLLNNFLFEEVRFYGESSSHTRILHFKIAQPQMVNFFKTGIGGVDLTDLRNNFVPLNNHSSDLPFVASNRFTNTGDNAMLNRPFFRNDNTRDWRINIGNDWEMDDNSNNQSNNTIHQVWIR